MQLYHDTEWGVPVHQDAKLFEFLVLEGAQAGLSWSTILKRRQDYRRAFDNFDVKRVAKFKIDSVDKLLTCPKTNIVRNRLKIQSAITNARAFIRVQMNLAALINTSGDLLKAEKLNTTSLRIISKSL